MSGSPPIEDICEAIKRLASDPSSTRVIAPEDSLAHINDPFRFGIICPFAWPGAQLYFVSLEYDHFTPGTQLNAEFIYYVLQITVRNPRAGGAERINFHVASIPIEYAARAKDLAASYDMSLHPAPEAMESNIGPIPLPVSSPNLYALVIPPEVRAGVEAREDEMIDEVLRRHGASRTGGGLP